MEKTFRHQPYFCYYPLGSFVVFVVAVAAAEPFFVFRQAQPPSKSNHNLLTWWHRQKQRGSSIGISSDAVRHRQNRREDPPAVDLPMPDRDNRRY